MAKASQKTKGLTQELSVDLGNKVKMKMVLIPAGSFLMGDAKGRANEQPVHSVNITKPFYLGKYPLTREQWKAVMGSNPVEHVTGGLKTPARGVTWDDCQTFLGKLNAIAGERGGRFVLPTEAQWEYACRAGSKTQFCFGDDELQLGVYAWYDDDTDPRGYFKNSSVGKKKPNAWGLYDMHGLVEEFCEDWFGDDYYAKSPTDDPAGPARGVVHVVRGGNSDSSDDGCRSAARGKGGPHCYGGLRIAFVPDEELLIAAFGNDARRSEDAPVTLECQEELNSNIPETQVEAAPVEHQEDLILAGSDGEQASLHPTQHYPDGYFGTRAFRCMPPRDFSYALSENFGSLLSVRPIFTKDGRFVITPGPDLTICVWDAATGALRRFLAGGTTRYEESRCVTALALSPDETKIAAAGFGVDSNIVRIFNFADGSESFSIKLNCNQLLWLADSEYLVGIYAGGACWSSIVSLKSQNVTDTLHLGRMAGAGVNAADDLVVFLRTGSCKDAKLVVYAISNGVFSKRPKSTTIASGNWTYGTSAYCSQTGSIAVAQGGDHVFVLLSGLKGDMRILPQTFGSDGLAFSDSGKSIAIKDPLMDRENPQERIFLQPIDGKGKTVTIPNVFRDHVAMSWSPDDRTLAVWSSSGLELWNTYSGNPCDPHGHRGPVISICPAGPGKFASAGWDGTVRLWDVNRAGEDWVSGPWPDMARKEMWLQFVESEGLLIITGGNWLTRVRVVRLDDGKEVGTIPGGPIACWDNDRSLLWVRVWNSVSPGESTRWFIDSYTAELNPGTEPNRWKLEDVLATIKVTAPGADLTASIIFGGRWLLAHDEQELVIARWPDLTEVCRYKPAQGISDAVLSPDGKLLGLLDQPSGEVSIIAVENQQVCASCRTRRRQFDARLYAFSPDSSLLAWGRTVPKGDGHFDVMSVNVLSAKTGKHIGSTPKWLHVTSACFLDNETLLVGAVDGTISKWKLADLESGAEGAT